MNILLVCGECYAGKGMLISKLEKAFNDIKVIHVGDILRSKVKEIFKDENFKNHPAIDGKIIAQIVDEKLQEYKDSALVVIDNPMKNIEQAEAIIEVLNKWELFSEDIKVLWVSNERSENDYSKRGRADDDLIPKKLALWKIEGPKLRKYLEDSNVTIDDIVNTDSGFLLK